MDCLIETNYIIWNDFNTKENGILIEQLNIPPKPEERKDLITIEGRDGYLTINRGAYNSITYEVQLNLRHRYDTSDIKRHFKGSGKLLLSCCPEATYNATIVNSYEFERVMGERRICVITFELQPLAYINDVSTIEVTTDTTLVNYYNVNAYPRMRVYGNGNGNVYINGKTIQLTSINGYVDLDSELEICYKGSSSKNHNMVGDFPVLVEGNNTITFDGNISKIHINPCWRIL